MITSPVFETCTCGMAQRRPAISAAARTRACSTSFLSTKQQLVPRPGPAKACWNLAERQAGPVRQHLSSQSSLSAKEERSWAATRGNGPSCHPELSGQWETTLTANWISLRRSPQLRYSQILRSVPLPRRQSLWPNWPSHGRKEWRQPSRGKRKSMQSCPSQ